MGNKTRLARATSNSDSLRTTVPASIVKQFSMRERDMLDWTIDVDDKTLVIKISHIKCDANRKLRTRRIKKSAVIIDRV